MSLAQEHLEDLLRSGLDDEMIAICEFESLRPSDIKLKGVESAYKIPYFNLDGTRNCFERTKLFPPLNDADGHKQKYSQPKDSAPSLYLPPSIDWKSIASDVQQTIVITEGEKKALSLAQRGIHAIGVGGVWNWRQKLDNGERCVLPILDQFNWSGRRVELVPDSDCWRTDKQYALAGFYALAMVLTLHGANVMLVFLHESGQGKVGVDDWIISCKGDWVHQWPMLERVRLEDKRFTKIAKWYQDWTAKQATQDALRKHTDHDLTITESVGLYTVTSAAHGLTFKFDNLHTHGADVKAELSVTVQGRELRDHVKHNLQSDNAHASLARNLHALCELIPWKILIPKTCSMVLKRFREGEPILWIDEHTAEEPISWAVHPLVMEGRPTVIFSDGGKGKSSFALLTSLCVTSGRSLVGLSAVKGRALYCDWEDDHKVFVRRHHAIQRAHPELREGQVGYLACRQPIDRMKQEIARRIHQEHITFLVIDSLVKASGGGSDAEAADRLFAALRLLNVTALIVAHTPKPQTDGPPVNTIYGSVFNSNFAGATWEFKVEQETNADSSVVGLIHRKHNHTKQFPPIGLQVSFEDDGTRIRYAPHDLSNTDELEKSLPVANRIRNLLDSDGTPRTAKQIADELNVKLGTIKSNLSRGKGYKWSLIGEQGNKDALWTTITR